MRIFKYRTFHQWTKSERIRNASLREAIEEIHNRDNISNKEKYVYRKLAKYYLEISAEKLDQLTEIGECH